MVVTWGMAKTSFQGKVGDGVPGLSFALGSHGGLLAPGACATGGPGVRFCRMGGAVESLIGMGEGWDLGRSAKMIVCSGVGCGKSR